ncbi:MAG: phage holin family protein [Arthrobacter sp.]|nr:phage holin family protein [Arthrobacter sp.]MDZ4353545.1 phage holin family protein [Arthrobacter sp.]
MSTEIPHTAAHVKAETSSLGDLLGEVTRDMSTLMRQEVELAKVELKQSATRAGKGAGMLAGAGVAGHFVLLFLSLALWWALGTLIGLGWSGVVLALIWGIVAAVLASRGRKELNAVKGMPQTAETLQEIPPTFKPTP